MIHPKLKYAIDAVRKSHVELKSTNFQKSVKLADIGLTFMTEFNDERVQLDNTLFLVKTQLYMVRSLGNLELVSYIFFKQCL